jgi:transcriptional regulator with XRE-family HTH domain
MTNTVNNIKQLRTEKKLSQSALSKVAHVSEVTIIRYEKKSELTVTPPLKAIAKALGVKPEVLFTPIAEKIKEETVDKPAPAPGATAQLDGEVKAETITVPPVGRTPAPLDVVIPPAVVDTTPTPIEATEAPVHELKKPRQITTRQILLIVGGACLIGLGVFVAATFGLNSRDPYPALIAIVGITGGGFLIYLQARPSGERVVVSPRAKPKGQCNSLSIYARKETINGKVIIFPDYVTFELLDKKDCHGQPQQCLNDGKFYYVHIYDINTKELKAFVLPDTKYVDPAIAARYLQLPAQRRYLRHRTSLLKAVSPWVLGALVLFGFIALIAVADESGKVAAVAPAVLPFLLVKFKSKR